MGDLTGLGIWFVVMFFAYKLGWVGVCSGAVIAAYKLCVKVFCCDVTKEQYQKLLSEKESEKKYSAYLAESYRKAAAESRAETERVLHMYEILKEAKK